MTDEATGSDDQDAVRRANERERHLHLEPIIEDAEELFRKHSEGPPPLQPDDPPPGS